MAEILAIWRDVWKRLEHNPLLLLLIVLGVALAAEGSARLFEFVYPKILPEFGLVVGALIFPSLIFVATLLLSIVWALVALAVEMRGGGLFLDSRAIFVRRFLGRVALTWLVLLIAPNLLALPIGFLGVILPLDPSAVFRQVFDWGLVAVYALVQAYLAALLLRRLPAIATGGAAAISPLGERLMQRRLLVCYLILFGAFELIEILCAQIGSVPAFASLMGYRIYAADISIRSLLVVLLAFVAYERGVIRDPGIVTVFD